MTLIGSGFSEEMEVTVCGEPCPLDEFSEQTVTSLVCITPTGTGTVNLDFYDLSRLVEKPQFRFLSRSDTNHTVLTQRQARSLKFQS